MLTPRNDHSPIPTLLDGDGSTSVESNSAKAACLNNFLYLLQSQLYSSNRCKILTSHNYCSLCPIHCPAQLLYIEESVLELLAGLDISKSTGSNGISPKTLKSTSLSTVLHRYARCSNSKSQLAHFPTSWKLGRITPIPEGTDKSLPSGYRPISLLPVASEHIEHHVKTTIEKFLQKFLQASRVSCPTGFTVSVLIRVLDDWQHALDQGNEVCIEFIDVSKAFDTVPHLHAIAPKSSEMGLDPYLIRWS